ncbi:DNA cytosine methyltransferase [Actinacidiphila sp. bgisy167]|uniref:DNA cytosine methyltransferase n=1 Tax=Actinacidiphila sp. bgisy167 TaxID=3413797 RepID=UPI003D7483C4
MADGTRSGLWLHIARAIEALNPCLVVIENVRGLLTSPAGSPGDVEPCPWCLGDTAGQPAVRALGAVLGSLADLGFDALWCVLRASDVGAPHSERIFLAAWPSMRSGPVEDADEQPGHERRESASDEEEARGPRPQSGGRGRVAAADAEGVGRHQRVAEPASRERGPDAALGSGPPVADSTSQRHGHSGTPTGHRLSASALGSGAPLVHPIDADGRRAWGPYAAAIARWERATRPAPRPTDEAGRLSPLFVE